MKAFLWRKRLRNLEFDASAFEDMAYWIQNDRKIALRIVRLIKETQRTPFKAQENQNPSNENSLAAGLAASIGSID
jgi:Txe/YoeB family toxin of Txe-Axe toxin-antitoxin module